MEFTSALDVAMNEDMFRNEENTSLLTQPVSITPPAISTASTQTQPATSNKPNHAKTYGDIGQSIGTSIGMARDKSSHRRYWIMAVVAIIIIVTYVSIILIPGVDTEAEKAGIATLVSACWLIPTAMFYLYIVQLKFPKPAKDSKSAAIATAKSPSYLASLISRSRAKVETDSSVPVRAQSQQPKPAISYEQQNYANKVSSQGRNYRPQSAL